MTAETVFFLIEIVGVIAYAISGALVAIDNRVDLFGVLFLAVITTFGGGITRDLLLGATPPQLFVDREYWQLAVITVAVALLVFVIARIQQEKFVRHEATVNRINNIFDALGLGVFSASGARMVMNMGYGDNWFLVVSLGMITASFGGMLRDILIREVPFILKKRIYAIAAIVGAGGYYIAARFGVPDNYAMVIGIALGFGLRMLATVFKWNFPIAIVDRKPDGTPPDSAR